MSSRKFAVTTLIALTTLLMPKLASAETLQILRSDPSTAIVVLPDSSLVLESGNPFIETSIANPSIADIRSLTTRQIALSGVNTGRTTLTIMYPDRDIIQVEILVSPVALSREFSGPVAIPNKPNPIELSVMDSNAAATISVPSSGAIVIESDVPFESWTTTDPRILDAVVLFRNSIYILGKEPGVTTLTLLRGDSATSTFIPIEVHSNIVGID